MSAMNAAHNRLRAFHASYKRIQGEIDHLNEDKKDLFARMKADGFDTKAFKAVLKRMKDEEKSSDNMQEFDHLCELYRDAIDGKTGVDKEPEIDDARTCTRTEAPRKPSTIPATTTRSVETPHDPATGEILDEVAGTDPAEQKEDISREPAGSEEIDISIPQFLRRG